MTEILNLKNHIEDKYPQIKFLDKSIGDKLLLEFSTLFQREYFYLIYSTFDCIFLDISAQLKKLPGPHYFWHKDFNLTHDYNKNTLNQFFETLDIIISHKTRIIQKKNIFNQSFDLQYSYNNLWKSHYQNKGFRFSKLIFPATSTRTIIYK
jgi:hypothetical protein